MTTTAPIRIFVVDDDIDTTESMRLLLKLHGHDVRVANQGASANEEAPAFKPDVMRTVLASHPSFQVKESPDA